MNQLFGWRKGKIASISKSPNDIVRLNLLNDLIFVISAAIEISNLLQIAWERSQSVISWTGFRNYFDKKTLSFGDWSSCCIVGFNSPKKLDENWIFWKLNYLLLSGLYSHCKLLKGRLITNFPLTAPNWDLTGNHSKNSKPDDESCEQ